ncbi:GNAT family N-acetyltransferase [Desulfosarcina ovata]|uniref:N-acetyltransferase domain-containing protein n=2 Tax=Desulfosarcina ovata TaxID=83564 RepID=A0A5K8ACS2_9BACT|nr:GNAT family N-acetyltransferase [Desulfosarcina ovata]BBO83857.1 hypothetical protein DSCO28_44230 [Desulfosarcina ovata subsp. sediminis]BBO90351.1 hypothetical protein DSCOOX_35310 [Desulfosarcina ovata subsp. ovata]
MTNNAIQYRMMTANDFDAIVAIDTKVLNVSRPEYYRTKFEKLFESRDYIPTSLVAEDEGGKVVGFVMGELFMGEYGIFQSEATLDTLGVDPDYQRQGIGDQLVREFIDHLKRLGVNKINTLVNWDDAKLVRFFGSMEFSPSKTINLERTI